jgi:iron complex outermembrane recepter protein
VRITRPRIEAEASIFSNHIDNYIYYHPTGELDPRLQRFPVFEARGEDAQFDGVEGRVQLEPARRVVVDGSMSWVRGTRLGANDPLPAVPPRSGRVHARFEGDRYFFNAGWQSAAAQQRVPRPIPDPRGGESIIIERPTPGHALLSAGGGFRWSRASQLHTVTLQVDNVTDTAWRDHLSRIKEVAPQPGRNVRLLYRVQF